MTSTQVEYWNGPAAERWTRYQEALDRALEPFGRAILAQAAILRGERVIDVGCGCGATTLAIADLVGTSGHVMGIDVSSMMLGRARLRLAGRSNVSLLEGNAATQGFDPPADAMVSRFGIMFFDRPIDAFRNLRRGLVSGGRVVFACWRAPSENAWVRIPMEVTLRHVDAPAEMPQDEPGPFAFANRKRVEHILRVAGFTSSRVDPFDADVVMSIDGVDSAVEFAMTAGTAGRLLVKAPADSKAAVRDELRHEISRHVASERVALGGAVWIASAIAADHSETT
jgi:SAM-dependent methyltransferase